MKRVRFVLSIIALLVLATVVQTSILPPHRVFAGSSKTFSLVGYVSGWNYTTNSNPPIVVTQGDNVTINLSSGDTTHLFFIDVDRNGASPDCSGADICSKAFPPSTKVNFLATFAIGTYTYYCSIHPGSMYGSFTIQGPPPPPPQSDFGVASNPTSLSVSQGSSVTSSLTITSVGGFAGMLNLSATVSPSGPQVSIGPSSVTLSSGGSATVTLTASASGTGLYSSPTPTGTYTITVKASNSTLARSSSVSLTVVSPSSPPTGSAGLTIGVIAGGVVAAIVIIGLAAYLIRRKSPSKV